MPGQVFAQPTGSVSLLAPAVGPAHVPVPLQVSVLARLPALGLRVLQLHKSFEGHATLQSSVHLYLPGLNLPMRRQEPVPVHVLPAGAEDICLENQHLRACFSGRSGLLQVSAGLCRWRGDTALPLRKALTPVPAHTPQSIRLAGEEREQRVSSEFLVYGTRASKDKSGAYLFLPDGEAKVQWPPL